MHGIFNYPVKFSGGVSTILDYVSILQNDHSNPVKTLKKSP